MNVENFVEWELARESELLGKVSLIVVRIRLNSIHFFILYGSNQKPENHLQKEYSVGRQY
jgi:hypothetical protein